jgi:DNA polymerase V
MYTFLCDMRCFYVSAETIFRPDIRKSAVLVVSNNDGAVVALNPQAKAAGIKKFEPLFKQHDLIKKNNITVFSSNYALYGAVSSRIMSTLALEVPKSTIYSIDECFCDVRRITSDKLHIFAKHLRDKIWKEQRIPMGVSGGNNYTLAKIGQYAAKSIPRLNGVCLIETEEQRLWLLKRIPVSEVWGVGRKTTLKLNSRGILSALDLANFDLKAANKLGTIVLERTVRELRGEQCIEEIDDSLPQKKQIICSRSFGKKITLCNDLKEAVANYAVRVSEKLRQQNTLAGQLTVFIRTSAYASPHLKFSNSKSTIIHGGSHCPCRIAELATTLVEQLYRPGFRYAKAGVIVHDIRPENCWIGDLFVGEKPISPVLDAVNKRFGRGTLKLARQGGEKPNYGMKQEHLSPNYLTRWSDIPLIKC